MIENFRYISPWNDFEDAIKEMKDVLKKKQAYWAVGFIDEFDLYIDNAAAEKMEKKTFDIIYDEILYLLKWRLEKRKLRAEDIRMAISASDNEISEEEYNAGIQGHKAVLTEESDWTRIL